MKQKQNDICVPQKQSMLSYKIEGVRGGRFTESQKAGTIIVSMDDPERKSYIVVDAFQGQGSKSKMIGNLPPQTDYYRRREQCAITLRKGNKQIHISDYEVLFAVMEIYAKRKVNPTVKLIEE